MMQNRGDTIVNLVRLNFRKNLEVFIMLTKTVTVEVPAYLYEESQRLATLGFFRDFADVVLAGLRRELREAQELLAMEPEDWKTRLNALRAQIQKNQTGNGKKKKETEEELIAALRAARKRIWEKEYRPQSNN
jgi:Arc/MetJ-type ribon-helix-helix transcriptional regulator